MLTYEDLCIPRKNSNIPIRVETIRTISGIQHLKFCSRTKQADCDTLVCEQCLFSWHHVDTFKKWYRENKLRYRNLRLVASFE